MVDFRFATTSQILQELGSRLRGQRLSAGIKQNEMAERAGVSLSVVKKIESGGNATLRSFVSVAQALSLHSDLSALFEPKIATSIAEMERAEHAPRKRVRTPREPP